MLILSYHLERIMIWFRIFVEAFVLHFLSLNLESAPEVNPRSQFLMLIPDVNP